MLFVKRMLVVFTVDASNGSSKRSRMVSSHRDCRGALFVGTLLANRGERVSGKMNVRARVFTFVSPSIARNVTLSVVPTVEASVNGIDMILVCVKCGPFAMKTTEVAFK